MQLLAGLDGLLQSPKNSVMSIGNFDGVHLGHRRILQTARQIASDQSAPLVVVTFEPHPMTVLRPADAPPRLTPPAMKLALIEAEGADYLVILPPEKNVLDLTAEDFWTILKDKITVSQLVEGATFRFGRGAKGSVTLLKQWAADSPLKLHVVESLQVPLLDLQITPVSSSVIRFLLAYGRVREAAICLGRPYLLAGTVEKGHARGKSLGFPTANLNCDSQFIPADGVYAARCSLNGKIFPVALSIGTMPTFGENPRQIEAHIIGFDGDLYGQTIALDVLDWIRQQRAFNSLELLKLQIQQDIDQTKNSMHRDFSRPIADSNPSPFNPECFA
jgi:riboflavin kinase/FMN adenylyltransferase